MLELNDEHGQKLNYDPSWQGPLKVKRDEITDAKYFRYYAIFHAVWLSIALYAYIRGSILHMFDTFDRRYDIDFIFIGFLSIVISSGISGAYVLLLNIFPKFLINIKLAIFLSIPSGLSSFLAVESFKFIHPNLELLNLAFFFTFIFVTLSMLIISYRKKIYDSCHILGKASLYAKVFPITFLLSIMLTLSFIAVTIFAGTVSFCLYLISNTYAEMPFHIILFYGINLLGYLWTVNFIRGFFWMVLSGCYGTYYWTLDKTISPKKTLHCISKIIISQHIGTVAFGSLILNACQFVNITLKLIKRLPIVKCYHILASLEKKVEINHTAYIMCMLHGKNLYQSAEDVNYIIKRNRIQDKVLHKIVYLVLFFDKLFIIILGVLSTWGIINLCSRSTLLTVPLFFTISTAAIIFNFMIVKTAVNTIFLCVLEDSERNDGSIDKPYFGSTEVPLYLNKQ